MDNRTYFYRIARQYRRSAHGKSPRHKAECRKRARAALRLARVA